jgi:hypothetical protein
MVRRLRLSRLQARLASIRADAAHKLTSDLTRWFETIAIEDLNVSGMAKHHSPCRCGAGVRIPRKAVRNCILNAGFAANAAHNISVMPMPRSI